MKEPIHSNKPKRASGRNQAAPSPRAGPSPPLPCRFTFVESPASFRDATAAVVRLPRGIRSKQKLFAIFADKLHFPNYFGWNWDALEECLRDLSWLSPGQSIAIVHEDLPFGAGGANRGIYLDLLREVLDYWSKSGDRSVHVIMPMSLQTSLTPATNTRR